MDAAIAVVNAPFRMSFRIISRPANGDINRAHHTNLMAGLDLRPQQIKAEIRVNRADLGRIVTPTVMTLGKDIDLIYIASLEGSLPLRLIEPLTDTRNEFRRVEVKMDLTSWQMGVES